MSCARGFVSSLAKPLWLLKIVLCHHLGLTENTPASLGNEFETYLIFRLYKKKKNQERLQWTVFFYFKKRIAIFVFLQIFYTLTKVRFVTKSEEKYNNLDEYFLFDKINTKLKTLLK